jgi:hypothetical protein
VLKGTHNSARDGSQVPGRGGSNNLRSIRVCSTSSNPTEPDRSNAAERHDDVCTHKMLAASQSGGRANAWLVQVHSTGLVCRLPYMMAEVRLALRAMRPSSHPVCTWLPTSSGDCIGMCDTMCVLGAYEHVTSSWAHQAARAWPVSQKHQQGPYLLTPHLLTWSMSSA